MSPKKKRKKSSLQPLLVLVAVLAVAFVLILVVVSSGSSAQLRSQALNGSESPSGTPPEGRLGACYHRIPFAPKCAQTTKEECFDLYPWSNEIPIAGSEPNTCWQPGEQCIPGADSVFAEEQLPPPAGGWTREQCEDAADDPALRKLGLVCHRKNWEGARQTCDGNPPKVICSNGDGAVVFSDNHCYVQCATFFTCPAGSPSPSSAPPPPPVGPPPPQNPPPPPGIVLPSGTFIPLSGQQFQSSSRRSFTPFFQGFGSFFRRR